MYPSAVLWNRFPSDFTLRKARILKRCFYCCFYIRLHPTESCCCCFDITCYPSSTIFTLQKCYTLEMIIPRFLHCMYHTHRKIPFCCFTLHMASTLQIPDFATLQFHTDLTVQDPLTAAFYCIWLVPCGIILLLILHCLVSCRIACVWCLRMSSFCWFLLHVACTLWKNSQSRIIEEFSSDAK